MEQSKPWYASITLWSAVITAAGVFAPRYAPAIGGIATDAATIIGLVGSVIGRLRATQQVTFQSQPKEGA